MVRALTALVVIASLLLAPAASAKQGQQARPHGQSYAAWGADWWTWALSQPATTNPVLDTTGANCAVGQDANVWFLAGTFATGAVARECMVPAGTAMLVPVINLVYCAFAEDAPETRTEAYVRSQVAIVRNGAAGLSLTVDGKPVRRVTYAESELFSVTLPEDNLFGLPAETEVGPCADAGYYALLPPLPVGEHTVRIQGTLDAAGLRVDVTYRISVAPRAEVARASED